MILDNENEHPKVHEWISKYPQTGKLDIVMKLWASCRLQKKPIMTLPPQIPAGLA